MTFLGGEHDCVILIWILSSFKFDNPIEISTGMFIVELRLKCISLFNKRNSFNFYYKLTK